MRFHMRKDTKLENRPNTDTVLLGVYIPSDVKSELAVIAREHDRSLSAEARVAIREYVASLRQPVAA